MTGDVVIDSLQQVFRQRGVEANGFAEIRRNVELDDGPDASSEVWIAEVSVDWLALRQGLPISNGPLTVKRQGFKHIVQGLFNGVSTAKAAWGVWDDHAVIRVGVLVDHHWKFHWVLLIEKGCTTLRVSCAAIFLIDVI